MRGGEKGRYLLDDRRVEAVKAAVQPHALEEKKREVETLSHRAHTPWVNK